MSRWSRAGRVVSRLAPAGRLAIPARGARIAALALLVVVLAALVPRRSPAPSRPRVPTRARGPAAAAAPRPVGREGPIAFDDGACVAFGPTGRPNGATVFLDPGHGGVDPGAISAAGPRLATEKQVTLAVARRALPLLRRGGYRVVMSRVRDVTVAQVRPPDLHQSMLTPAAAQREIEARNLCANAARADLLVALHMNAFGDPSATGAETVFAQGRRFSASSRRLAGLVQRSMLVALRVAGLAAFDRRVVPDSAAGGEALTPQTANYHHLIELGPADPPWLPYPSRMPGVVVEPLFLTNPAAAAFALSRRGQLVLARALVAALDAWGSRRGAP